MIVKAPTVAKFRELEVTDTRIVDDVTTKHRRVLQLTTKASNVRHRWSEDLLLNGDFGTDEWESRKVWAKDANGDYDVEGATLHYHAKWRERGTVGAVTLNKTSPLGGLERDAVMALDDADTRLAQVTKRVLAASRAYTLRFLHAQSDAGDTIDFAIRYWDGTAYKWWDGTSAWDTENWITATDSATEVDTDEDFTPDTEAIHEVLFKPTGAVASETCQIAGVYIADQALATDPLLPAGEQYLIRADGEGRFSFILDAPGTEKVQVAEVEGV